MPRRTWLLALVIVAAAAAVELAMGRHPICTCGTIDLWVGARDSPKTSQMLLDWYSLSHIVHGLLFYAVLWLLARRSAVDWRFIAALLIEASWEVIENTPMVIERYRATTAALGYSGDSVLNSMSDIAMMALGFLVARKLPVWAAVALLVTLEVIPLLAIRDNLALNVWALIAPNAAGSLAGGTLGHHPQSDVLCHRHVEGDAIETDCNARPHADGGTRPLGRPRRRAVRRRPRP